MKYLELSAFPECQCFHTEYTMILFFLNNQKQIGTVIRYLIKEKHRKTQQLILTVLLPPLSPTELLKVAHMRLLPLNYRSFTLSAAYTECFFIKHFLAILSFFYNIILFKDFDATVKYLNIQH